MSVFTPNLGLINMTPGSGAVAGNVWPTNENTSRQLVDDYFTSVETVVLSGLTYSINGGPAQSLFLGTINLQSTNGQSDQVRRRVFLFSGSTTFSGAQNLSLQIPVSQQRSFTIINNSNIGIDPPSGSNPAQTSAKPGMTIGYVFDGTVAQADGRVGQNWLQRVFIDTLSSTPFASVSTATAYLPSALTANFTPKSANSTIFLRGTLDYQTQWTDGSAAGSAIMEVSLRRNGAALWTIQAGGSNFMTGRAGVAITPLGSAELQWSEASPGTSAVTYALYCRNAGTIGLTNTALKATLQIEEVF